MEYRRMDVIEENLFIKFHKATFEISDKIFRLKEIVNEIHYGSNRPEMDIIHETTKLIKEILQIKDEIQNYK